MATFSKLLLRPGVHHAPQGPLEATPERMKRWAEQFARMKSLGMRLPVSYGHFKDALPTYRDEMAKRQFWLSAANAGYVDALGVGDGGKFEGELDVPGVEADERGDLVRLVEEKGEDGVWRRDRRKLGEVSIAVGDFTDGKGREWKDVIKHVALTPMPVFADQGGFAALSLAEFGPDDGCTLSLDTWEGAIPEPDKEEKTPPGPPEKGPPPGAEAAKKTDFFPEALTLLAKHGIPLPPGTNAENFPERLWITLHAMQEGDSRPGGEEEDEDEEGVTYEGEQTREESRPVMMSLSTAKTEKDKVICRKEQERHKERQLALVNRLVKSAIMPGHEGKRLTAALSEYELSLDEETLEPVRKELDLELSVWEKIAANVRPDLLKKAKAEPAPHERKPAGGWTDEEIAERARAVSVR